MTSTIYLRGETTSTQTVGDTIDSVVLTNVSGASGVGKSWQVLPDGSTGEYWAGFNVPADPALSTWKPGWVALAGNFDTGVREGGEWILPGSALWNRVNRRLDKIRVEKEDDGAGAQKLE